MLKARWIQVCGLLILSAFSGQALADADLDAELEAEWGDRRVKTYTAETPESRYEARLKLLEANRDAEIGRCKARVGNQYCSSYAEEQFRRELRVLEKRFEGQMEEMPKPKAKSRGFGGN